MTKFVSNYTAVKFKSRLPTFAEGLNITFRDTKKKEHVYIYVKSWSYCM